MAGASKRRSTTRSTRTRLVVTGAAAVVVVGVLFAVGSSRESSEKSPSSDGSSSAPTTTVPSGVGGPGEYQPVVVDGVALDARGDGAADPAQGREAPILRGYSFDRKPVTIDPRGDGAPTMLVFLAHWCPHCNREVPRLLEWKERGLVPARLRVVGVTTGSRDDQPNWPPSKWLGDFGWPWEVLADSQTQDAAAAYGVDGYPFMVLIDSEGTIVHRMSGEVEVDDLVRIVEDALGLT